LRFLLFCGGGGGDSNTEWGANDGGVVDDMVAHSFTHVLLYSGEGVGHGVLLVGHGGDMGHSWDMGNSGHMVGQGHGSRGSYGNGGRGRDSKGGGGSHGIGGEETLSVVGQGVGNIEPVGG